MLLHGQAAARDRRGPVRSGSGVSARPSGPGEQPGHVPHRLDGPPDGAGDLGTSHAVGRPPGPPPGPSRLGGPAGPSRGPPRSSVPQVERQQVEAVRGPHRTEVAQRGSGAPPQFGGERPVRQAGVGRPGAVLRSAGSQGEHGRSDPDGFDDLGQVPRVEAGIRVHEADHVVGRGLESRPAGRAEPAQARRPPPPRVVRPRRPCRRWIRCRPRSAGSRAASARAPTATPRPRRGPGARHRPRRRSCQPRDAGGRRLR